MAYILFISCTLALISIILNSFGMYFLRKLPTFKSNQRLLLINLSFVEIFTASVDIVRQILNYFGCTDSQAGYYCIMVLGLSWYLYFVYLLIPFMIMLDRFIGGMKPLKYANIFPKRKARLIIIIIWSFGLVLLVPRVNFTSWVEFCPVIAVTLELPVLLFIIITYSLMVFRLKKHRKSFSASHIQSRISKVAAAIIISFVLLLVMPDLMVSATLLKDSTRFTDGKKFTGHIYLLNYVNFIMDPVIYLYGYPPLREAIKRKIFRRETSGANRGQQRLRRIHTPLFPQTAEQLDFPEISTRYHKKPSTVRLDVNFKRLSLQNSF